MCGRIIMMSSYVMFLTGCVFSSNGSVTSPKHDLEVGYSFTGIPLLLGSSGSSVPISTKVSITAAHVAKYSFDDVIAVHPFCDIALIKSDNSQKDIPEFGYVYPNSVLINGGRNLFGVLVESQGIYITDLQFDNLYSKCHTSISTAPLQSGMSGGGAYNDKLELVGINFAIMDKINVFDERYSAVETLDRNSAFVPLAFISDWVKEKTGIELYR